MRTLRVSAFFGAAVFVFVVFIIVIGQIEEAFRIGIIGWAFFFGWFGELCQRFEVGLRLWLQPHAKPTKEESPADYSDAESFFNLPDDDDEDDEDEDGGTKKR